MKDYVKAIDKLKIVPKFLMALFLDPLMFGIYRIAKGRIVIGIFWIVTLGFFGLGWLIDLISIIASNKVIVLT